MLSGSVSELQTISIIDSDSRLPSLPTNRRLYPRCLPSLSREAWGGAEIASGTRFRPAAQDQAA